MEIVNLTDMSDWRTGTQILTSDGREAMTRHIIEIAKIRQKARQENDQVMINQTNNTLAANHFIVKDFPGETHLWNREQGIDVVISTEGV